MTTKTSYHVCELCEAGCGLAVEVERGAVVSVRGNDADVLSKGFICPKGLATLALDRDPDRLRGPVKRTATGSFEPIEWDEAFDIAAKRLRGVRERHGRDAIAVYMGTPIVHKHSALLMRAALLGALGTKNSTSAGSQDTSPRFAASHFLYGSLFSTPVPDIDRTQYFLCIGANPLVSNGSLLTAPNIRSRLQALLRREGTLVVVDPRRTETARMATEHVSIIPGSDAAFVLALVNVLLTEDYVDEAFMRRSTRGWPALRSALHEWTPGRVAAYTGVPPETIRRIAKDFAEAPSAAAYARLGVCNQAFGTLASFAVDLLNITTGRLGVAGGSMFSTPAVDLPTLARLTRSDGFDRFRSRVRGLPELAGDLPASILAEEMETPGEGQVRAFVTFAGNPVLSTPNGKRLAAALEKLDFMVSIDLYVNETTRHADVILPPCSPFSDEHVDLFFAGAAARDGIRWTQPAVARTANERADWEILLELAFRLGGGPTGIAPVDAVFRVAKALGYSFSPEKTMDMAIRTGPYGDHFLPWRQGLTGRQVREAAHGIDLGPLKPGFERRIYHRDGLIDVAPPPIVHTLNELATEVDRQRRPDELLLIGRRDIRSNNSWMHNLPRLVSGKDRCVLFVHPHDAARLGIDDGDSALLESQIHSAEVPVKVTDEMRPGVVSLPHGYGHAASKGYQHVAGEHAGISANDWTNDQTVESIVGQSILTGIVVRLRRATKAQTAAE